MLTESFFVRRVNKTQDPESGEVKPESDNDGEVGIVRTIQFVSIPDANSPIGQRAATILGVCWEQSNYPAICWEDPEDLEHLDDTLDTIIDRLKEQDDERGESFLDKCLDKVFALYGADAVIEAIKERLGSDDDEDNAPDEDEDNAPDEKEEDDATQSLAS